MLREIHDKDGIFAHILHVWGGDREVSLQHYFAGGAKCAAKLEDIARAFLDKPAGASTLLEFASGSGRVTRHLVGRWKSITASDIQPSAVEFLKGALPVDAYLSSVIPEELAIPDRFDVVFALSFFSHMPETSFARWIAVLSKFVAPGGLFIFTTHSPTSIPYLVKLGYSPRADDFWFEPRPSPEYGQTIVSHRYVENLRPPAMREVAFRPAYWWTHQDTYIWKRAA